MWLLLLAATLRTIAAANCSLTQPEDVRLAAALDLATAGCGTVVYTTLAYGPGTRLPHPGTRLAEMAREGSACYIVVAGAASAASLAAHLTKLQSDMDSKFSKRESELLARIAKLEAAAT